NLPPQAAATRHRQETGTRQTPATRLSEKVPAPGGGGVASAQARLRVRPGGRHGSAPGPRRSSSGPSRSLPLSEDREYGGEPGRLPRAENATAREGTSNSERVASSIMVSVRHQCRPFCPVGGYVAPSSWR